MVLSRHTLQDDELRYLQVNHHAGGSTARGGSGAECLLNFWGHGSWDPTRCVGLGTNLDRPGSACTAVVLGNGEEEILVLECFKKPHP